MDRSTFLSCKGRRRGKKFAIRRGRQRPVIERSEPRILLSTYTVNTTGDPVIAIVGVLSLREAVADANAHAGPDTINFDPKVFAPPGPHQITLLHNQISFTDKTGATTVNGPGASVLAVSGNGASRIFNILASATVTINSMTVTNGFAGKGAAGGGIMNAGTLGLNSVTITKCKVDGTIDANANTGGPGYGGGIFSSGSLTLQNSTVSSNTATGASNVNTGTAYDGQPAAGGGIFSTGALVLTLSVVSSNQAVGGGSMLRPGGTGGAASGGGIFASGALALTGCTLNNNSIVGGDNTFGNDVTQLRGGGAARGGAIDSTAASTTIVSSQLSGNTAVGGNGEYYNDFGAVAYGGAIFTPHSLTLTSTTLNKNSATAGEGVVNGGALAAGGGAYVGSTLVLNQSTVSGNTAQGGSGDISYYGQPGGNAQGGGIWVGGALSALQSSVVNNNAHGGDGAHGRAGPPVPSSAGGVGAGGGAWTVGQAVLTNCTLAGNNAVGGIGGSQFDFDAPGGNAAGGSASGGALHAQGALKLRDCTVSGNVATGGVGGTGYVLPGLTGKAAGGGISATVVNPLFTNSIISANKVGSAFNDIAGTAQSTSGFNLIGVGGGLTNGVNGNHVGINNPKLQPLSIAYGGTTPTMLPMATSPAVNAGSNALIPAGIKTDQRGFPRIFNHTVDIGADELVTLTLTGTVFNDINGDGVRQGGDPALSGWQVYIDLNDTGVFAVGDPSATTNAAGHYTLTYTPTSLTSVIVREIRQANWRRTKPAGIYPLGFYTVGTTAGTVANLDFGNSATALVAGSVYHDTNANGKKDPGESGLANWQIHVDIFKNNVWVLNQINTVTDSQGNYSLVLKAGKYRIHETPQGNLHPKVPANGTLTLTLATGATDTDVDFGNV
ncbi:MAG TPA: choice-of-anchor Q domain-containing protein [Humisphaera sp.]|jgi:hypothetical protein|nr:choice-of-anchor Q domain-containing protein [Humisphaera sp.]